MEAIDQLASSALVDGVLAALVDGACCMLAVFSQGVEDDLEIRAALLVEQAGIDGLLDNTLQDILIRYKRKKGFDALWQPGTDHAGIATQMVVERQMEKENLSRHDLGREKFIERVWDWKADSGGMITSQRPCSDSGSRTAFKSPLRMYSLTSRW